MTLVPDDIARIDALLRALGDDADSATLDEGLRRLLPGLVRRHCDAADVEDDAFRTSARADLHLLDATGHCIRVTDNPVAANGVLIAARAAR